MYSYPDQMGRGKLCHDRIEMSKKDQMLENSVLSHDGKILIWSLKKTFNAHGMFKTEDL